MGSAAALAAGASGITRAAQQHRPPTSLAGELGVTTGSFVRHLTEQPQRGRLRLLDLPGILRYELDMRVIDLMTATLPSLRPDYLHSLRYAAEQAGCTLTNLKMNQPGLDLGSEDPELRRRSIDEYKRTIDAAAILGVPWVRPLPGPRRPSLQTLVASYRELVEYAQRHGISLLVENYGWLASDPAAIPEIIAAVGNGLAAQPDTGNWSNNEIRYAGLARAFPLAVSCDFKARTLGPQGEHEAYDLKRCFDIGWDAGFRGPWCFEHSHSDLPALYRGLGILRDKLRHWISLRTAKPATDGGLREWTATGVLPAPEANQAAAADEKWVYAITNSQIARYDRQAANRVAISTGEAKHLNSGFLANGRLYCAHSNYPQKPEQSEIKVLDMETMRLSTFKDFGSFGGSLTWAILKEGHWWCNFARYGDDNAQTFLVEFDSDWREISRWTYPPIVTSQLGRSSLSGGIWRGSHLLVTGHDDPVLFRLRLPDYGSVLDLVSKERVPFTGQGIADDPKTGGLVGINRAKRRVVFAKRP